MIEQNPKYAAPKSPAGGRDAATFVKAYWLPFVLVIVAIIFIATNTADATFNIGWVSITQPLWLLLTVTVLVGFVIGWFVGRRTRK
ncbi:LapA family protein [Gordonia caeni]|uniref:DUF1049 domain-containing protein n=1 Tax=Gordonia caeni TaxID=1007097 RepID=A0ABP7PVT0_9ACTN